MLVTESQLKHIIVESYKRIIKEYDEFGSDNIDISLDQNKLTDYDKGNKVNYIFFDELKGENGFSVEDDLGIVNQDMSFQDVKEFMLRNTNTMYLDEIKNFDSFAQFLNDYRIKERQHRNRMYNH